MLEHTLYLTLAIFLYYSFFESLSEVKKEDPSTWHGKWFPHGPDGQSQSQKIQTDQHGRVQMGVANSMCDDGKVRFNFYVVFNFTLGNRAITKCMCYPLNGKTKPIVDFISTRLASG